MNDILHDAQPDMVFVYGEVTTTFAIALASFYKKMVHSGDIYFPWPEEMNRINSR